VKILLQRTLQTILDLEFGDVSLIDLPAGPSAIPARHFFPFSTRFGSINLGLPAIGRRRPATNLFARYPQRESLLVFELKRLVMQGVAGMHAARAMAEELCGHRFSPGGASQLATALERELALHYRRQLETEHPSCALGSRRPW
jgi:hypothetical protein